MDRNHTILSHQIHHRLGVSCLEKLSFVLQDELVEVWIDRHDYWFPKQMRSEYVSVSVELSGGLDINI
eukprot:Gb_27622 [translate_table: standard]